MVCGALRFQINHRRCFLLSRSRYNTNEIYFNVYTQSNAYIVKSEKKTLPTRWCRLRKKRKKSNWRKSFYLTYVRSVYGEYNYCYVATTNRLHNMIKNSKLHTRILIRAPRSSFMKGVVYMRIYNEYVNPSIHNIGFQNHYTWTTKC